jgi:hypothetical protein
LQEWPSLFGGKDNVQIDLAERLRHRRRPRLVEAHGTFCTILSGLPCFIVHPSRVADKGRQPWPVLLNAFSVERRTSAAHQSIDPRRALLTQPCPSPSTPDGVVQRRPGLADPCRPTPGSRARRFRTQNGFCRTSIPDVAVVNIQTIFRHRRSSKFVKASRTICTIPSGSRCFIVHSPGVADKGRQPRSVLLNAFSVERGTSAAHQSNATRRAPLTQIPDYQAVPSNSPNRFGRFMRGTSL